VKKSISGRKTQENSRILDVKARWKNRNMERKERNKEREEN
jgi:hypothetical protein